MTVTLENFGKDYYLQLKGNLSYSVKLGSDARGNLVRIENELAQLPLRLNGTKAQLQNTYTQMENARAEIGKPFPQEAELREKIPIAMEGGGYIYHSDHSIPPEVTLETYLHAMKVLDEIGTYK